MLLLCFAGGLRRSEIVGLDLARDQTQGGRGSTDFFPDKGAGYPARQNRLALGRDWLRCVGRRLPCHRPADLAQPGRHRPRPLFRRDTGKDKAVGAERLNDREIASQSPAGRGARRHCGGRAGDEILRALALGASLASSTEVGNDNVAQAVKGRDREANLVRTVRRYS